MLNFFNMSALEELFYLESYKLLIKIKKVSNDN
jgi:hypothetical protein